MRHRTAILTVLTVSTLLLTSICSASAAGKVNFTHVFNTVNGTYLGLQSLADAHNNYIKHHHSICSTGQKKKWSAKAQKDVATVLAVHKRLTGVTGKARQKHVYHDLMQTVHDLKSWSRTQVVPKLPKCKNMSDTSYTVEQDLNNVATDLGIQTY